MNGTPAALGARAFDVLAFLDAHSDRVVSKAELLDNVWGGLAVEEGNLTVQISALRKVLGARAIATVPGVGYKLPTGRTSASISGSAPGPTLPAKPSLAVLPFANLSHDTAADYLVDGIVADLISAISRVPGIFVIAASSSFKYKGQALSLADVGAELGVRYILEGSMQVGGERLRITCQLVEAESGRTLWSERFSGTNADVFDLQDQITERTAAALELNLIMAEAGRARAKPTGSIKAYDLCLQAAPLVMRVSTKADFDAANALLDEALALDPGYSYAQGLKVRAHVMAAGSRAITHDHGREKLEMAYSLLNGRGTDPLVLSYAGHMVAYLGNDHEQGYRAIQVAKGLNPNSVLVRVSSGWVGAYMGRYADAIEDFEWAYRLNPLDPNLGHCRSGHGYALMGLGRYAEAVARLEEAQADDPGFGTTTQALAAAHMLAGETDKGRTIMAVYRKMAPDYSLARYHATTPFIETNLREAVAGALRDAGLPEG